MRERVRRGTEGEQGEHVVRELVKHGVVKGGEPSAVLVSQREGVRVVEVRQETGPLPRVAGGVQEKLPGGADFQKNLKNLKLNSTVEAGGPGRHHLAARGRLRAVPRLAHRRVRDLDAGVTFSLPGVAVWARDGGAPRRS